MCHPLFSIMVSSPVDEINNSRARLVMPSHTTGLMSTPNAGGTNSRVGLRTGSVATMTAIHGSSLSFRLGYHDITSRKKNSNVKANRNTSRATLVGLSHAGTADKSTEDESARDDAASATAGHNHSAAPETARAGRMTLAVDRSPRSRLVGGVGLLFGSLTPYSAPAGGHGGTAAAERCCLGDGLGGGLEGDRSAGGPKQSAGLKTMAIMALNTTNAPFICI
mmetsp:Transcript_7014/g.17048  ORF Transcript_7014/g.17048 Transcript_7014/m.17048 type:complete len:222 (+) Transcript_7014:350-1015(+)